MKSFCYRVYYEDTDAGGVVYYANYLKFYERARTDFLRDLEIIQSDLIKYHDLIFIVSKCDIKYIKPAKLDDALSVDIKIEKIGAASIEIIQQIKIGNILINEAVVKIVSAGYSNFRPKKIPNEIIKKLKDHV